MNALPIPSSSLNSDFPDAGLPAGEVADHLRALLGSAAQGFGERHGIVGRRLGRRGHGAGLGGG
jgi:hypothetical protein